MNRRQALLAGLSLLPAMSTHPALARQPDSLASMADRVNAPIAARSPPNVNSDQIVNAST